MANITELMDQLGSLPGGHQELINVLKQDPVRMTSDMLDDPTAIDASILTLSEEDKTILRHHLVNAIRQREHSTVNAFM